MRHQQVIVAIPARDEAASIGQCIRSVDQSAADVPIPVVVVAAADACGDDTYAVARDTPAMPEAFTASYEFEGDDHSHVHGANIGICAAAYLAAGGWCPYTVVGEDHLIWNALRRELGHRVRQTTRLRVLTSARTRSRVVGGFATNLGNLGAQLPLLTADV